MVTKMGDANILKTENRELFLIQKQILGACPHPQGHEAHLDGAVK
jgi:hypothetical protein